VKGLVRLHAPLTRNNHDRNAMALVKCVECNHQISTDADKCPQCGAKQNKGGFRKTLGWIIVVIIAFSVIGRMRDESPKDVKKPLDPKAEQEKNNRALRGLIAKKELANIKETLNDPSSLSVNWIGANEKGTVVCFDYRAKNGFGGLVKSYTVFVNGQPSTDAGVWNSNCSNKKLYDVTFVKEM